MISDTVWRAREIVKNDEVKLISVTNQFTSSHDITKRIVTGQKYHFKVKQRNGKWTDVWFEKGIWACNSVTDETPKGKKLHYNDQNGIKRVKKWGCVMNTSSDKTKPYCSHSLACEIYIKNLEVNNHAEEKRS